ncbi:hypothetical protein SDC9_120799 [bioreactor metagenome]|uniref:Uncharacterized protein n=1 Tax=bioreactor metagenome TaxID=1076179 RepID=A0A645CA59_9ZZZZ
MVFVPFHHPLHAVDVSLLPFFVIAQAAPIIDDHKTMRLEVSFIDDVETVLVA